MGGTQVKVKCRYCGKEVEKDLGDVNKANKICAPIYCDKKCAGLARRTSIEEKKKVKAAYDKALSQTSERQAARKRYFQKSYKSNPEKYREIRKNKYQKHLEYLHTEKYKEWKKLYDEKHLAKKYYGVFWESALLLKELELFLLNNAPYGMKFQMGITNKTQKRERLWHRTKHNKNLQPQI